MKKSLGLIMLTFYGTGMILGAGIYSVIGKAAGTAQESLWMSFLLAAVSALLTALSYAELSTTFPKAGAEYVFLREAFPRFPLLSVLCGSMMTFAAISTATAVALAFAGYSQQFLGLPEITVAFFVLMVFTAINIRGIQESGWVNALFTLLEVSGLLLFIFLGLRQPEFGQALQVPFNSGTVSGAALLIFAYLGFENMVNLVEESKQAERNIPRAILISVLISTLLYLLVALSALALMRPQELALSDAALSDAAFKVSPQIARLLGGIALFSTGNTVLIALLSASRVVLGMAREGDLPAFFAQISKSRHTPWRASLIVFALAVLLLPLKKIEVVASVSSLSTMISFTIVNIALIYLRYSRPELPRPFKVPLNIKGFPVLSALAALSSLFLIFHFSAEVYLTTGGVLLLFLLAVTFRRHLGWRPK